MNEIHFRRSQTQFHKKFVSNLAKVIFFLAKLSFILAKKFFTKAKLKRDLVFHLGKVQFQFGEIDMEKV